MNKIFSFCLLLFAVASCQSAENQPVITELQGETLQMYEKGKKIFGEKCSSCHNENMITNSTGSALGGITQRRTKEWLRSYIRNSPQMLVDEDSQALEIYQRTNFIMQSFPNLTDEEIDQILLYIETTYQNNKIRLRPVER